MTTIAINLLPKREVARRLGSSGGKSPLAFNASLLLALGAAIVVMGLVYLGVQWRIAGQRALNTALEREINRLGFQIQNVTALQADITALRQRAWALTALQTDRNRPVYLLSELARLMPDGVYLNSLREEDAAGGKSASSAAPASPAAPGITLTLRGYAQSEESVSELLRRLAEQSPWFSQPELVEVIGLSQVQGRVGGASQRMSQFTLRAQLMRETARPAAPSESRVAHVQSADTPVDHANAAPAGMGVKTLAPLPGAASEGSAWSPASGEVLNALKTIGVVEKKEDKQEEGGAR
jgi:type IV pilus assembly protein PilN